MSSQEARRPLQQGVKTIEIFFLMSMPSIIGLKMCSSALHLKHFVKVLNPVKKSVMSGIMKLGVECCMLCS